MELLGKKEDFESILQGVTYFLFPVSTNLGVLSSHSSATLFIPDIDRLHIDIRLRLHECIFVCLLFNQSNRINRALFHLTENRKNAIQAQATSVIFQRRVKRISVELDDGSSCVIVLQSTRD